MVPNKVGLMLSKKNAVNEGPQIVGTAFSVALRPRLGPARPSGCSDRRMRQTIVFPAINL